MVSSHTEPTLNKVPYYNDLPVSAGFKDVLDGGNETPTSYISIPGRNADFFFPVSGTSMEPEINDGDIVGVKRVGRSEGIVHGDVYMVVTNYGITLNILKIKVVKLLPNTLLQTLILHNK